MFGDSWGERARPLRPCSEAAEKVDDGRCISLPAELFPFGTRCWFAGWGFSPVFDDDGESEVED